MTELDLVCEEPYKIGLLGSVSFMAYSLGSLFMSSLGDKLGRWAVVMITGMMTPVGLLFLINCELGLQGVTAVCFVVALSYPGRSSGAYLFNTEFIETQDRITMMTILWTTFGTIEALSALWFWYTRDQTTYLYIIVVLMLAAHTFVYLRVPESPLFLLEKNRFKQLDACFQTIGS